MAFDEEKALLPLCTVSDNPSEVFSLRFSHDGSLLAAGCGDGMIRVYSSRNGAMLYEIEHTNQDHETDVKMPITSLRFRPADSSSKNRNVLLAACADGTVSNWHVMSGKLLHQIQELEGPSETSSASSHIDYLGKNRSIWKSSVRHRVENQVFCLDYSADASQFASAGKDQIIRVYDDNTKALVNEMISGTAQVTPGHSNRVFSIKFSPDDPNMLMSGGWDSTVQFWDTRVNRAVGSIFGPHICGDALDANGLEVLTGSWRTKDQLQIWDIRSYKELESIPWNTSTVQSRNPALLYCAQFSKGDARYVAAGGSGSNEAKVFDRANGGKAIGGVSGLSKAIFCLDFEPKNTSFSIGSGDHTIRILGIEKKSDAVDNLVSFRKRKGSRQITKDSEQKLAEFSSAVESEQKVF